MNSNYFSLRIPVYSNSLETSYVFTAWDEGRPAYDTRAIRDIEKYVSVEVDLDGTTDIGRQKLRVKK
jgi:hypothetical protein